ncbi:glutathione S-transferase family protein [Litoribrevibacter albus]|uniref:Glutathione S-transferase n=1 Tax=Litoribrevibacter albus TaxID=1473156 RepID=A0AA37S6Y5_9GAMM|nr:glutathione S-transferase family protein [Litoribrevibacter albus]GLQ29855.1 glutathione S-transferase [Litoribrevibacter albus]
MRLIIGNKNYSSWSLRPWLLMKHAGLKFEEIRIPLFTESTAAQLAEYSPSLKVPVLIDQGDTIWDSLAIMEYISERHMKNTGWPEDPIARAVGRSSAAEMHSGFFAIRNQLPMNCRADLKVPLTSDVRKEVDRIEAIWTELREEFHSYGPWLLGEFSIADAMFAPMVVRFSSYQVDLNDICERYMDHLLSDPYMEQWLREGRNESEVIDVAEINFRNIE